MSTTCRAAPPRREATRRYALEMVAADQDSAIDVDPQRLQEWLSQSDPPQVIDVREPSEREAGHIGGTRHVALVELAGAASDIERDRPVVFYCRVGGRSTMAAQAFRASGFEAYSMTGGLARWVQEGLPLEPDDGHVADH
jgi:rhodanese-related sulfurtransferase